MPAPAAVLHTRTDMPDSTAPAAAGLAEPVVPVGAAPAAADIAAENAAAAAADADLLSQLVQGYSADSWFASARNTADLDTYQGLYSRGERSGHTRHS